MSFAIYDYDQDQFIGGVHPTYEGAKQELLGPDSNCIIVRVAMETDVPEVFVMAPGEWDNELGPQDWYAVGTGDEGIIAYAWNEELASSIAQLIELDPDVIGEGFE